MGEGKVIRFGGCALPAIYRWAVRLIRPRRWSGARPQLLKWRLGLPIDLGRRQRRAIAQRRILVQINLGQHRYRRRLGRALPGRFQHQRQIQEPLTRCWRRRILSACPT